MPKKPRPIPGRPTVAPGVPTPVSWGGPSQSLSKMATQIGSNRALSEFYKVMVESQLEYDQDEHEFGLTRLQDNRRNRQERNMVNLRDDNATELSQLRAQQEIDVANHKEYLKGDKGSGLGVKSTSSNPLGLSETELAAEAITAKKRPGSVWDTVTGVNTQGVDPEKTKVETVVEAKTKLAAEKKAIQDEEESDWWKDKVSDNVQGAFGAISDNTPEFVKDVLGTTGDVAKFAADTPVGGAVMDVGKSAFRQLSRPLHATAGAADAWFDMDKEEGNTPEAMKWLNPLFGGQSPSESLDDISLEGIGNVFGAMKDGFMLDERKTWSDVVRTNAARDNKHDAFDGLTYQTVTGIGMDLIADPLNLIGVGLVTKPYQAVKGARDVSKVRGLAEEAVSMGATRPFATKSDNAAFTVDEITSMLTGRYTSKSQRIKDAPRIQANAKYINDAIEVAAGTLSRKSSSRLAAIDAEAVKFQEKLKKTTSAHASSVAIDELTAKIAKKEAEGLVPAGTVDKMYTELDANKVLSAFKKTWSVKGVPAARQKAFDDALGDEWKNHPALSESDRADLFTNMRKNAARNPEFKDVMGHNQAVLEDLKQANARLALMEKRGNAADVTEAKAWVNKAKADLKASNVDTNRALVQSFQQRAYAKAMENLGQTVYTDPERAGSLKSMMAVVEEKLRAVGTEPRKNEARAQAGTKSRKPGAAHITRSDPTIEYDIDPTRATPNTGASGTDRAMENVLDADGNQVFGTKDGHKFKKRAGSKDSAGSDTRAPIQQEILEDGKQANKKAPGNDLVNEDQTFFNPDSDDIDSLLAASPDSFNYESQLQTAYQQMDKELQGLVDQYPSMDTKALEIPEVLKDGVLFDDAKFFNNLEATDDPLVFKAPESPDPATNQWIQAATQRLNVTVKSEFTRLRNNAMRRVNEDALKGARSEITVRDIQVLADNGDPNAAKILTMFSRPPRGLKTEKADAVLYPHIEYEGKKYHETGLGELAGRVDGELSAEYTKWINAVKAGNITEEQLEHLQIIFKDLGLSVGNANPEGIYRYVLGHKDSLLEAVSGPKLMFAQEFKKQHGMTLQEARDLRAGYTGNTVGKPDFDAKSHSKWQESHPQGVSENAFVREVMSAVTPDEILKALDGSPISVTIPKFVEMGKTPAKRKFSYSDQGKTIGWKKLFEDAEELPKLTSKVQLDDATKASFAKKAKDVEAAKKRLHAALDEAGMPKGSTLDEVRDRWAEDLYDWLDDQPPATLRENLKGNWQSRHNLVKQSNAAAITARARAKAAEGKLTFAETDELRVKAMSEAKKKFVRQIEAGDLLTRSSDKMLIPHKTESTAATVKRVADLKKAEIDEELDLLRAELRGANTEYASRMNAEVNGAQAIRDRIKQLDEDWKKEKAEYDKALAKGKEAAKVLQTRIQEEALLSIATASINEGGKALSFSIAGKALEVKGSAAMFRAAEKASGVQGLKQVAAIYRNAFASQRKLLPEDMQVIANRALSNPSEIISHHVRDIRGTLGMIPIAERKASLRGILTGSGNGFGDATQMAIQDHMEKLLPYFQGKAPVGGKEEYVSLYEINRFLPDKFKFETKGISQVKFKTALELTEALAANATRNGVKKGQLDPIEMVWTARIASEQSMARHALVHSINESFGIKRMGQVSYKDGSIRNVTEPGKAVEKLKDHGWTTHKEFGNTHYFPKESAQDIKRLMDMFEPRNANRAGKFIDEVTGMWKTTVTIYNIPGYYVRNGIGEAMSAWLGGVHDPTAFRRANNVLRFYKHEGAEVEALRDHMPALAKMVKGETHGEIGKKPAARLQNGKVLDTETVGILYRDQGLSSGFINSEYRHHYSKTKENIRRIPGAKRTGKMNEGLRAKNESYEDFYRLGHFIAKMEKAPKSMSQQAAAEWAAKEVRKYHFDYTDFSKFEKTYMLRAFPFYKWTRKALPLMSSMLFAKPGKMMAYPKIMSGASEGLVGTEDLDPSEDQGFMPNYQNFAPGFVQDLWGYQIGGPTDGDVEGTTHYGRAATPQMDSMNALSSPVGTAASLLNPMFKEPIELTVGKTMGNMSFDIENNQDRVDSIAGNTPQTALLNNLVKKLGFTDTEENTKGETGGDKVLNKDDLIRLLTGMGYYEAESKNKNSPY